MKIICCDWCQKDLSQDETAIKDTKEFCFETDNRKICLEFTIRTLDKGDDHNEESDPALCVECLKKGFEQVLQRGF